jgi:hypothetical protein
MDVEGHTLDIKLRFSPVMISFEVPRTSMALLSQSRLLALLVLFQPGDWKSDVNRGSCKPCTFFRSHQASVL